VVSLHTIEARAARLGVPPTDCVFIDNGVKNLDTASALGMDTVLFNRDGESYGGKIVNTFEELAAILP
jgi:FMN phosphatase YigB (HAD superfamily)